MFDNLAIPNGEPSEDERIEQRFSHTARLSQRLAAIEAHGASVVNAAAPNVSLNQAPATGLKYDSFNKCFVNTTTGQPISQDQMQTRLDGASVQRIPDNGCNTNYERGKITERLNWIKSQLEAVEGYDAEGKPILRLQGLDRAQMQRAWVGELESSAFAFDELDQLDSQRQLDDNARRLQAESDADREARIEHEAVLEAERIEIRRRAEAIIAAKNKTTW